MTPRVLLSALVRALPVVGPLLRRLDTLEMYVVIHEAELDLVRAERAARSVHESTRGVSL